MMIDKQVIKKEFEGIDRQLLVKKLPTTLRSVSQFANGFRRVSPQRAIKIELITKGAVRKSVLRPDIFGKNI